MANKEQVYALHLSHPEWTVRQVADALKCHPSYVRATAGRGGYKFASATEREAVLIQAAIDYVKEDNAGFASIKYVMLEQAVAEYLETKS